MVQMQNLPFENQLSPMLNFIGLRIFFAKPPMLNFQVLSFRQFALILIYNVISHLHYP